MSDCLNTCGFCKIFHMIRLTHYSRNVYGASKQLIEEESIPLIPLQSFVEKFSSFTNSINRRIDFYTVREYQTRTSDVRSQIHLRVSPYDIYTVFCEDKTGRMERKDHIQPPKMDTVTQFLSKTFSNYENQPIVLHLSPSAGSHRCHACPKTRPLSF